ncbi:hypothetical protein ZEAMMB73_Zm00001d037541 [Zea mays]|uniref:DNAJC9 HTH domain-containing protein n=1 Tax=Zea mays TaxID=4577 RepID=A0A1D6LYS0_MAIZE|nr:hypothetical protein ZEAMMB73_Zm00001d037541 [Zea mays]
MAAVNLLAESAAVRLRAPAPPGAGEELAARLTECGFPTTARRGGVVAGLGRARASGGRWRSGRRNSYCGAGAESRGRSSRFAAARMRPTSCTRSVSMSATERFLDLLHNPYVKCGIATTALFGLGRVVCRWIATAVTEADIEEFEAKYRGSDSEKTDLKELYTKYKGNMNRNNYLLYHIVKSETVLM